jgi:hypothetical protein
MEEQRQHTHVELRSSGLQDASRHAIINSSRTAGSRLSRAQNEGGHCMYVLKVEHLLFREFGKFLDNIEIQFQNK